MELFTESNRPEKGKFAFVVTKRGDIYGGQVSYSEDSIVFNFYVNNVDTTGVVPLTNAAEWMYAPELKKYYHF